MGFFDGLNLDDLFPKKKEKIVEEKVVEKEVTVADTLNLDKTVKVAEKVKEPTKEEVKEEIKEEAKEKKKERSTKKKEEVAETISAEEYEKQIKALTKKVESLTSEKSELIEANTIIIDAQNTDDRKKILELMREGKIISDTKDRPIILAEQHSDIYTYSKPPIHRVYCDEITDIYVRKHYTDLIDKEKGDRELIRTQIWVYHKGYATTSLISEEQLKYILDNSFYSANKIRYAYSDLGTMFSMTVLGDDTEPSLKMVTTELERQKLIYEKHFSKKAKKFFKEDTDSVKEEEPAVEAETDKQTEE